MFIGYYNMSIILTFVGLFFSILGIDFSLNGNIYLSLVCLLLSGVCDTFDGTVARMIKRKDIEKQYGIQLDSLVDVVCFGFFPIVICYCLGYHSIFNIIVYFFYLFCGVTRLAYFNVGLSNKKYFKGLPITTSSFILPLLFIFSLSEWFVMTILIILGLLFIINFKIPKSNLKLKLFYLVLGIVIISLILLKYFGKV